MNIGYARVSTPDQKLELQPDDLKSYGCETVYKEKVRIKIFKSGGEIGRDKSHWV